MDAPRFPVAVNSLFRLRACRAIVAGCLTLLILVTGAASASGGEIYGTIKENGKPIAKDVEVTIKIGETESAPKKTDEFGSYRILVSETGPCTITIKLRDISMSGQIQSYSKPTRFDLVVEKSNGQYVLQRQ